MKKKVIRLSFLILLSAAAYSQSNTTSSGGEATGSGGKVSFSIGQIDYQSYSGLGGFISQGVQQPFELLALGTSEIEANLAASTIFPNPAKDLFTLSIQGEEYKNLNYQLYDIAGKTILTSNITQAITTISVDALPNGSYFLAITNMNSKNLKTFNIIKN